MDPIYSDTQWVLVKSSPDLMCVHYRDENNGPIALEINKTVQFRTPIG